MQTWSSWLVTLVTHTPGGAVQQGALGVGCTEDVGAGTLTVWSLVGLRADTDLLGAAESVARTVLVPLAGLDVDALRGDGVRHGARRAAALEAAWQIGAGPTEAAGGDPGALVNIDTADLGVPGVAGLALTDEAAGQVGADAVLSTGSRLAALIDVNTAGGDVGRVVGVAGLALAEGFLVHGLAVGVV